MQDPVCPRMLLGSAVSSIRIWCWTPGRMQPVAQPGGYSEADGLGWGAWYLGEQSLSTSALIDESWVCPSDEDMPHSASLAEGECSS